MPPLDAAAPPERIAPGCVRITLPDPFVPGVTAAFLIGPEEAPLLVDSGADSEASATRLRETLADLGHAIADLPMVLSHTHLDHAGGLLRQAPRELTAHARAAAEMRKTAPRSSRGPEALRRMGLDETAIARLAPDGEPVGGAPLLNVSVAHVLEGDGGELSGGGAPGWRWILAEGHAPGHLMLFDPASRTLLAGDQFLDDWKTPLIVSDPGFDSLGAFMASIDAARALKPARMCSSHTATIEDPAAWLADTKAALEGRLERVARTVEAGAVLSADPAGAGEPAADPAAAGGMTAEEVLRALYPDASHGPVRIVFLREILAMLRHLSFQDRLHRETRDGAERFRGGGNQVGTAAAPNRRAT